MANSDLVGTLIFLLTGLFTYKGFTDKQYLEENLFHVDKILIDKEYRRIFTSGFLHANWIHFGFNMGTLLAFSYFMQSTLGATNFLLIYFVSLLGGDLLALYIHRNHGDYRALGASGAVCGVLLASVVLFPEARFNIPFSDASIPRWILAIAFVLLSIFGIKKSWGNIGHDAHLGGGLCGVFLTMAMQPSILKTNWWIILLIVVPSVAFLILMVKKPEIMMIDNYWGIDFAERKQEHKVKKSQINRIRLDYLLEKIKREGLDSLSKKERAALEKLKDEL
jgi:membrane associated rhomboid family serine protease